MGLEILDNMPHDRLYTESYQDSGGRKDVYTHASTVEIIDKSERKKKIYSEELKEHILPIEDCNDDLI